MTHLRRGGFLNSLMIEVQGQAVEREIPSETNVRFGGTNIPVQ